MTAFKQSQDVTPSILTLLGSGHQKPARNLPTPNVQQKTPDDGQRCPKHVEFYDRIILVNQCVWLVIKKKTKQHINNIHRLSSQTNNNRPQLPFHPGSRSLAGNAGSNSVAKKNEFPLLSFPFLRSDVTSLCSQSVSGLSAMLHRDRNRPIPVAINSNPTAVLAHLRAQS